MIWGEERWGVLWCVRGWERWTIGRVQRRGSERRDGGDSDLREAGSKTG